MTRHLVRTALLTALLAAPAWADEPGALPDIGSSAGEVLSPAQEAQYGAMTLHELRRYNMILDDPLIDSYLQNLGFRLAARSDRPRQPFTFFMVNSRQINAFATLGGYIGVNAGLFLTAESEDEVAAVMAHEIAHVTQRHVLRSVETAQRESIPILLATLGAMIAAQQAGGDGDATQAALVGGLSLMQQRQINYTRSNESEADRIGIQTLARSGFEPLAMADFFSRMERAGRGNQGGYNAPEYLRSHPVNSTRISEAKDRARGLTACGTVEVGSPDADTPERSAEWESSNEMQCTNFTPQDVPRPNVPSNPLLSDATLAALHAPAQDRSELFPWARERMRVLTADSHSAAIGEYERLRRADPDGFTAAQRYGLALARSRASQTDAAQADLLALRGDSPVTLWIDLALAENEHRAGHRAASTARYEQLLRDMPRNRAVALSYATSLAEDGSVASARKAQELLRPLLPDSGNDPTFQRTFARASEVAGDAVRAGEAHAEAAYLSGRAEDALNQLGALKKRDDLDYYARSRIDARIAAITPTVLELRRQGIKDEEATGRLSFTH